MNTPNLKRTAYETERFPLHGPIDGVSLCVKIAQEVDSALGTLQKSAKESGIEIIETRVSFKTDTEDDRPSGYFRVIATGVEKEAK